MIFSHVLYQLSYLGPLASAILHHLLSFVKQTGTESPIGSVGRRRLSYLSITQSAAHKKRRGALGSPPVILS